MAEGLNNLFSNAFFIDLLDIIGFMPHLVN